MGIKSFAFLLLETALALITHGCNLENDSLSSQKSSEVATNCNLKLNNPVKSIRSEDGDIIDCINIYKQPAFNHPALKNHKIQMKPSFVPTVDITSANKTTTSKIRKEDIRIYVTTQIWQRSGSCPEGTVPIRRMPRNNAYDARKPSFFNQSKQSINNADVQLLEKQHSLAVLHTEGYAYIGAKGDIYVWNPPVELDDEYTTSQVSLKSGPRHNYEEIEGGWTVNPRVYKDRQTRFFVYWTVDASMKTGCFDHFCPGFVQVNKEIALGAAIHPISSPNGLKNPITVYIFKDPKTDNWWVNYEDKLIGYWPANLFKLLRFHAETVQWGGEVYSSKVGTHPHTATGMGSGKFAFIEEDSGLIQKIRIVDNSRVLKYPEYTGYFSDEIDCYGYYLYPKVPEPEFYYGGPGRNFRCP